MAFRAVLVGGMVMMVMLVALAVMMTSTGEAEGEVKTVINQSLGL